MGGNSSAPRTRELQTGSGYGYREQTPYSTPSHRYGGGGGGQTGSGYGYPEQTPFATPSHPYSGGGGGSFPPTPSYNNRPQTSLPRRRLDGKFGKILDNYQTLDEVTAALAQSGLESSNLIVGIDFTKSNEWTGARSFNRKSLHCIGNIRNPYEQAISIIGQTLSAFDEDNLIPCFGFGDATTHDQDVFSFNPDNRFCVGFEEVLARYKELTPQLRLAGPTSFAPIIDMATDIVEESGGQYHVLLIIADGQVTRSVDTHNGQLSSQEQKTIDAIVRASEFPLSIVLVGVGDGPWDTMKEFDDNIPARTFDNFQFVNFTEIMSKKVDSSKKQTEFALSALMEIPSQYIATIELGILGRTTGNLTNKFPLPPPIYGASSFDNSRRTSRANSFQQRAAPPSPAYNPGFSEASSSYTPNDNQICPICLTSRKDMAFGCGHQTCCNCGEDLELCPICRCRIQTRIKLY